jgi:hypothetical protein
LPVKIVKAGFYGKEESKKVSALMKVLKLHPLMTISLLQLQFQKLLDSSVIVYINHHPAAGFDTLRDAGYPVADEVREYPVDETLNVREFEEIMEEHFNLVLELSTVEHKPIGNKSLRLYQLSNQFPQSVDISSE